MSLGLVYNEETGSIEVQYPKEPTVPPLPDFNIPTTELNLELFSDAFKAADWEDRGMQVTMRDLQEAYINRDKQIEYKCYQVFQRGEWSIGVKDTQIRFFGPNAVFVDTDADLIADEDTIVSFLNWIYENGPCPLWRKK